MTDEAATRRLYYANNIRKCREWGRNCYAKHAEQNRKKQVERRLKKGIGQVKLETLMKYNIDINTVHPSQIKIWHFQSHLKIIFVTTKKMNTSTIMVSKDFVTHEPVPLKALNDIIASMELESYEFSNNDYLGRNKKYETPLNQIKKYRDVVNKYKEAANTNVLRIPVYNKYDSD